MPTFILLLLLPGADEPREHLNSENYTVTWKAAPIFSPSAELEIGHGSGHGFTLRWLRFRPTSDAVEVLSIALDEDRKQYRSKWPLDLAPVTVKQAQMKPAEYAAMLRNVAVINAAELKRVESDSGTMSSADFWVYARLATDKKTLIDLDWAGYQGSRAEVDFAKPQAVVKIALQGVKSLDFKDHTLTKDDRAWASTKFVRDWKKIKDADFHWWVRDRYIITIGVVGDSGAIAVLSDIMQGDPTKRDVYYAINALTRLTGKDVRDQPVEEMDVEKTRKKLLDVLREKQ